MYIIELDRWNIKQGIPNKPYTNLDYINADRNILGINNAIQYASANGFSSIVLPKGDYALCYPREIKMVTDMTFNLNGSTLKVIYDSDRRSPFDTRSTSDFYSFKGNSIVFENVKNAHILGGTIIGCRDDRSFQNSKEASFEHTYGVLFSKGTKHSSIKNCIVRDYMGDNITFSSDSIGGLEINQGLTLNKLNYITGKTESSLNTVITGFINLPTSLEYDSIMITGVGYSRQTNLNSRDFSIFYYDKDTNFIGVLQKRKIYTGISIPINATKFRLQFYNETNPSKNIQVTIRWGSIPHHNLVEYNEIYNGHRGGITLGGSYNLIQHNIIRDNGKSSVHFLDGKPTFPHSTRYAINQEDSFGDNSIIKNNLIYGSLNGILIGCYSIQIENNHIYNIDSTAINLYNLQFANIKGNFIYNCTSTIGLMSSNFSNAYVNISENSMNGGILSFLYNNSYQVNVSDNNLVDVSYINLGKNDNYTFRNNRIKYSDISVTPTINVKNLINCFIDSRNQRELMLQVDKINGCFFNNLKTIVSSSNQTSNSENIYINNCYYTNSQLINRTFIIKNRRLLVTRSIFTDTVLKVVNINSPGAIIETVLTDCSITARNIPFLFSNDSNQPNGTIKVNNCDIEISNSNFSHLIQHDKLVGETFILSMMDSKVIYYGPQSYNLKYFNDARPMIKFISVNNRFTNIILPIEPPNIFLGYDIDNTFKSKIELQSDGENYSATITHNLDTLEPYVLCLNSSSEVLTPTLVIVNNKTIRIKLKENSLISVTVKKVH